MPVYIGFLNRIFWAIFDLFVILPVLCFSNFDRFEPGTAANEMQHLLSEEDSFLPNMPLHMPNESTLDTTYPQ